ncbi:N-formylglutamate amidohydrolase [Methylocystis iwaonis]|uniref:N-formylglutamate amidohydrolase n=1 Tax=Methylocystis iwaonis TaxID=2885079 RepID=A0ABN6VG20_9HYPH|nr:N-formylglutamate amidohydrolase [Methylocystis iwaonis]BDV34302.1 N-formylglutamate amidohydrolase [Methylocystis iwaonis]
MDGRNLAQGEEGAREESPLDPELSPPFQVIEPDELLSPLVFSSPHSGRVYPQRFLDAARLDALSLRRSEDAYVDELFESARSVGAPMLRALFPRAYLDLNREPYELDPKLFEGPLPQFANTRSLRVAAGLGTVPRVAADAREIYAGRISLDEGLRRIEALYKPYHAELRALVERAARRFGVAIVVDCHSMPSSGARGASPLAGAEKKRVDFVIGDRYGASVAPSVVDGVEARLSARGYNVQRNRPYAGGFITEHFGRPRAGWHALQIEVSRGLYMNEATLEKNDRFVSVAADLAEVVAGLAQDVELGESFGGPRRMAAE